MPELPDITIYIESLQSRIVGQPLEKIRIASPFLLRSVDPPISEAENKRVLGLHRVGKQIVWELEGELFLVFHLMIAGRFHWLTSQLVEKKRGAKVGGKVALAAFDFPGGTPACPVVRDPEKRDRNASPPNEFTGARPLRRAGTLLLTEASSKKRASLHLVKGRSSLGQFNRGGLEVLDASLKQFTEALLKENHTLKRTLTDPRLFSAIGNAYSDEILHRAKLSPLLQSQKLSADEISRLCIATKETLKEWVERLRTQAGSSFPEKVTAFHPEMAVHGKYGKPCPVCGTTVQRIVYAENECNYCPRCQTDGKILADRSLSRLLKEDWPKTIEELEQVPGLSGERPLLES